MPNGLNDRNTMACYLGIIWGISTASRGFAIVGTPKEITDKFDMACEKFRQQATASPFYQELDLALAQRVDESMSEETKNLQIPEDRDARWEESKQYPATDETVKNLMKSLEPVLELVDSLINDYKFEVVDDGFANLIQGIKELTAWGKQTLKGGELDSVGEWLDNQVE